MCSTVFRSRSDCFTVKCMDDDNRRGKIVKIITRVHCLRYTNRGSARVRNTFFSSDDFLDAKLREILKFHVEIVPKTIAVDIRDDRKTRLDDRVPFAFFSGRFIIALLNGGGDSPLTFIIGNTLQDFCWKTKKEIWKTRIAGARQKATFYDDLVLLYGL